MRLEAIIKRLLAKLCDVVVTTSEDLLGRETSKPNVVVLQVIPVDVGAVPLLDMRDALKAPGITYWS
ncbi:hypothetical protein [Vreelandella massiliensis]|uniref:hypothetical protein n=1 Tax=Vreelandella massiliensis TaxID=1816686 RepID=UPI0011817B1B|nr:hypothetical protein [Halomonas massiliensis]